MRAHLLQVGFVLAAAVIVGAAANADTIADPDEVLTDRSGSGALALIIGGEASCIAASGTIAYDRVSPACERHYSSRLPCGAAGDILGGDDI